MIAAYSSDVCVRTGAADRPVILVNATGATGVLVEFAAPATVAYRDTLGAPVGVVAVAKGLYRLPVPSSGTATISWR